MLKDARKKYGESYANVLKEAFPNAKQIECNWGIPIIRVKLVFEEDTTTILNIAVNTETEEYGLNLQTYKVEDEIKVSMPTDLESNVIKYIVDTIIQITNNMFTVPDSEPVEESEPVQEKEE